MNSDHVPIRTELNKWLLLLHRAFLSLYIVHSPNNALFIKLEKA